MLSQISEAETPLTGEQVNSVVAEALLATEYTGKKVLLIVPDHTRTAPVGQLFKAIHAQIGGSTAKLDVMIALGTHHTRATRRPVSTSPLPPVATGGQLQLRPRLAGSPFRAARDHAR